MWQDKKYQFITLFIYLYEDHLDWDEVGFAGRKFTLYYTDIISVSGGNAGKHLGGTSRFEINTAGQTYKYSSTLGAFAGLEECIGIINERIQHFRNNGVGSVNTASFANNININPDNIEPTITRIDIFLEDGEWEKVKAYANTALDYFPTDYRLYKYLLLADMNCKSVSELKKRGTSFASNANYKKLERYADESLKRELSEILANNEKEVIYQQACKATDDKQAVELFRKIRDYKDSGSRLESLQTKIKANEEREKQNLEKAKNAKYLNAVALESAAQDLDSIKKAMDAFDELRKSNYKDSNSKYYNLKQQYDKLSVEKEYSDALAYLEKGTASYAKMAKAKFEALDKNNHYKDSAEKAKEAQIVIDKSKAKNKKSIIIVSIICIAILIGVLALSMVNQHKAKVEAYNNAVALYEEGDYENAKYAFDELGSFEDAQEYSEKCSAEIKKAEELEEQYDSALSSCKKGEFEKAIEQLEALGNYSDSKEKISKIEKLQKSYEEAIALIENGELCKAKVKLDEVESSGMLDKENYGYLKNIIQEYGYYAGTFVYDEGKKNAITQGGQDVDGFTVYVKGISTEKSVFFTPELLIEFDGGGSLTCERKLNKQNSSLCYFMHDTKICVEDRGTTHPSNPIGEILIITDYEKNAVDPYSTKTHGFYKRKDAPDNKYD